MPGDSAPGETSPPTSPTNASSLQFRRILVAAGLRQRDPAIFRPVWELVRRLGAEATVCHVEMRSTAAAGNESDGAPASAEETQVLRDLRAAVVEALGKPGHELPIKILHGDPGQRICEYADFLDCDLIVLGPREKASIAHTLRGSVSKYVVGNTRRAVLVLGS